MKIAWISDIHGNALALDAVLSDMKQRNVDEIVVLGDLCYRGPEPKRALDMIKQLNTHVIKGNADEWVIRGVKEKEVPDSNLRIMQEEQQWTRKQLNEEDITYLQSLPNEVKLERNGIHFHAFHATPTSLFDVVSPDASDEMIEATFFNHSNADIYLYGHIHKAYERTINGKTIINLGSVGLPFDGIKKASYVLIELTETSIVSSHIRVSYDLEKVCQQLQDLNYPNKEFLIDLIKS
ncbi:metallophosphoesterase family protein [Gracilibacillus marinus]|uniref:Metallophosphoesterase family protein n=1 Tax=Gracilibacillus marinus TaxID=630535 RepID=A0ABV8W0E1_9BACI